MTPEERVEWDYRYTERIGIMCGTGDPTPEQKAIAESEADEAIRQLRSNPG